MNAKHSTAQCSVSKTASRKGSRKQLALKLKSDLQADPQPYTQPDRKGQLTSFKYGGAPHRLVTLAMQDMR